EGSRCTRTDPGRVHVGYGLLATGGDTLGHTATDHYQKAAMNESRSALVSTPTGRPSSWTSSASADSSAEMASWTPSLAPITGSGGLMCDSTWSASLASPAKSASSRARSETDPATSAAITGGSARTTGICETPYSLRMLIASATVSV